jgi:hypothetical protein
MYDYLIVGAGIAGLSFAEIALQNNKSILVFENNSQNSSIVAGGMYNPVILKRFSGVWHANSQMEFLNVFYPKVEKRINCKIDFKLSVFRRFSSIEEQNNWFVAADKINLSPYLSTSIAYQNFNGINSCFGFGEVFKTGYLNTSLYLDLYRKFLFDVNCLKFETFDYSAIIMHSNFVEYNGFKCKNIIFAEGFGMHQNPFFQYLPLDGTKGELITIHAPTLELDVILNSSIFIIPIGKKYFRVGATYNWSDKDALPTSDGLDELLFKLRDILTCDFTVVEHVAGVRPTVRDRRPLVGTHAEFSSLHLLNGLGTRGVMLGPFLAKQLFESIENGIPLDTEINFRRYNSYVSAK